MKIDGLFHLYNHLCRPLPIPLQPLFLRDKGPLLYIVFLSLYNSVDFHSSRPILKQPPMLAVLHQYYYKTIPYQSFLWFSQNEIAAINKSGRQSLKYSMIISAVFGLICVLPQVKLYSDFAFSPVSRDMVLTDIVGILIAVNNICSISL